MLARSGYAVGAGYEERRRVAVNWICNRRGRFPVRVTRAFGFVFFRRRGSCAHVGSVMPAVPRVSCGSLFWEGMVS